MMSSEIASFQDLTTNSDGMQDGEIKRLQAVLGQEAGAEDQLNERLNFVTFKYQLLIDMVSATSCVEHLGSCPAFCRSAATGG